MKLQPEIFLLSTAVPPFRSAADALRRLSGDWSVRRAIVDHLAGATYRFAGTARLGEDAFEEIGRMELPAGGIAARRAYRLQSNACSVTIAFPSGNHFVTLDVQASQAVRHDCAADLYSGRFIFRSVDAWAEIWRVRGPAKHYSSLSRYRRLEAG